MRQVLFPDNTLLSLKDGWNVTNMSTVANNINGVTGVMFNVDIKDVANSIYSYPCLTYSFSCQLARQLGTIPDSNERVTVIKDIDRLHIKVTPNTFANNDTSGTLNVELTEGKLDPTKTYTLHIEDYSSYTMSTDCNGTVFTCSPITDTKLSCVWSTDGLDGPRTSAIIVVYLFDGVSQISDLIFAWVDANGILILNQY